MHRCGEKEAVALIATSGKIGAWCETGYRYSYSSTPTMETDPVESTPDESKIIK